MILYKSKHLKMSGQCATNAFVYICHQVHRGIKGVVRDKDTEAGIADAIIKVDDIDHHIRSGNTINYTNN